jgi:hypothetical protein
MRKVFSLLALHLKKSINRSPSRLVLLLFPLVVAGSLLLWGAGAEAIAGTYTTNFPLTENPISEGGHWINGLTNGLDWTDVATTPGKAFGTQTGIGPDYADSTALLTGTWGADQTAQATVYITSEDGTHDTEEVELRLRSSLSPHSCTGYEINFSVMPQRLYCQIVRWNGPLGNFTFLFTGNVGVVNGDVVKATAIGNTITMYINNVAIASVVDNTFPSGNPGMGFYMHGGLGPPVNYGFSSYTASDGSPTPTPTPTTTATSTPTASPRATATATATATVRPSPTPTATATATSTATPSSTPTPGQITLNARGYKVQGRQTVDLSWSGATTNNIDIYRNGVLIVIVPDVPPFETDHIGARGKGTYTYRVCGAGTRNCSNQVTVRFGGGG